MNPWLGKFVIGGVGSAVLGASLLGITASNALATTTSGSPATSTAAGAKHDASDRRLIRAAVVAAEATALGMKPEDLHTALKNGKSVSDLAAARGMNKEQFADKLANTVKPALDKLVDAKKITQAQDDRALARIRAGHIPFWDGLHHKKAAA
jgi:hypothetical protein